MAKKKQKKVARKVKPTKTVMQAPQSKNQSKNQSGIRPLNDRIVVRPLTEEEIGTRSTSGIIIPETVSKERPEQGVVVAVGPGRHGDDNERIPMSVSVGDRVIFSKYGFDEVKVGGKEYFIVSETGVLAVIND